MGRDTGGVRGHERLARRQLRAGHGRRAPDTELLVVTENGYGKRTPIEEYPVKGRGAMGVKTIGLTEKKGGVAGALIVREHQDLVFISQSGMVQRTGVKGISQQGRPAQGVRVMNLREDDIVSAVALVMEDEADTAAVVEGETEGLRADRRAAARASRAPAEPIGRDVEPTLRVESPAEPTSPDSEFSACRIDRRLLGSLDQGKEVVLA